MLPQVCLCLLLLIKCHGYQSSYNSDYNRHKIPQDVMVDVVNNLAMKLLAIHNEDNNNNIAISPYGALSVLVALAEGIRGSALYEIQRASGIPSDISVIRVGLRDIHRHLKSYFIPEEGFLSGLTLSHDNVTLHREYEDILKFYGYDINSFNNALYPDLFYTTEHPLITTDISTDSTITTEPTSEKESSDNMTTEVTTATSIQTTDEDRSTKSESTTVKGFSTTTETSVPESTTGNMIKISTTALENAVTSTTIIPTTISTISKSTTRENVRTTTEASVPESTTVNMIKTSTNALQSTVITTSSIPKTENERSTRSESTTLSTDSTKSSTGTTLVPESTTNDMKLSTDSLQSLMSSTTKEVQDTTLPSTLPTSEKLYVTEIITTEVKDTTTESTTSLETKTVPSTAPTTTLVDTDTNTITVNEFNTKSTTAREIDSTTEMSTIFTSSTKTDENISTTSTSELTTESTGTMSSEETESSSEITSTTTLNNDNESTTFIIQEDDSDTNEQENNETTRRRPRSVVDYVIARYYDEHYITPRPPPYYSSENELYFLVNGKHKEFNINYMTYDTVLPFHYITHLNTLALRFPLDSTRYYLLLLLPENVEDIDKLICNLRLNSSLKHIINSLTYTHVKAIIPSFMLKGYVILTSTFQKLGIRRVFEPRQADFSPMTSDRNIYVTNIEQAITVNIRNYVDPVTMNSNRFLYQNDPVVFKADHPFLYFVIDSEIDVTLMAGKIINPLNSRIR